MKLSTLALAGALALSAAGASLAQSAPPPGGAPDGAPGRHWQRPDPAKMAERHAEHLRTVLQLRPDQEPALKALIASMQPSPEQLAKRREAFGEMRKLTTPQRLDAMQARSAERQQDFARRADAIKRFYAQLSPAQQKAFDALPPPGRMGGRGHGGFGGHGKGFGPGGPGGPPPGEG